MTGCALTEYVIILNMCLQFSIDNFILQALGWALTEYGDSLRSLVTARLGKQIQSMHISPRTNVTRQFLYYTTSTNGVIG